MSKEKLLVAIICLQLSLIAGAVSFFARQMPVSEAASLQNKVWVAFKTRNLQQRDEPLVFTNSTRILMPAIMAMLTEATGVTWPQAFSLVRLLSILFAYCAFFYYLRCHFNSLEAFLGLFFLAATIPLTFNNQFELPTEFPEIAVFSIGMMFILNGRDWLLCLVILIGTFNRETTCFLPLILLFVRWARPISRPFLFRIVAAGISWLIPMIFLRWWLGLGLQWQHSDSLAHNLPGLFRFFQNFNPYNNYLFYMYLFGILWAVPFLSWRSQPPEMRRALLAVPIIFSVYLFGGGFMDEPREIVPLYALLVPAGLYGLREFAGKIRSEIK